MRWIVAAAVLAASWPGAAFAGWRGAEWGMTPEQVAAANPEAPLGKGSSSARLEGKAIGNVGSHDAYGQKLRALYYFDAQGLESIALTPGREKDCPALARSVLAERGEPVRVSDQVILKLIIWHDPKAANRIRLLLSTSFCTLYYERLSTYEAIDKAPR